jgi:hypothetical protein
MRDRTLEQGTVFEFVNENAFQEVEIRLRSTMEPHSCTGYEVFFRCLKTEDGYAEIVRWNGKIGDFTSLAKLSGDLDLHVRGTAARPAVIGRVNIAEGDIFFNGTKYRLERGDITFSNPLTIEPVVNLDMSARVQGYDVTIGLHGQAVGGKGLSMTYRSDPPLANSDIIALLAFGRTRGQGVYNASQPGANANDTATASNAILGEALNATFSDRVQRLFGASRVKIDPQFIGSENNASARVTIARCGCDSACSGVRRPSRTRLTTIRSTSGRGNCAACAIAALSKGSDDIWNSS